MNFATILLLGALLCTTVGVSQAGAAQLPETCYLFSYFIGNGEDGLHLAWSRNGYKWEALGGGKSYLQPKVGENKLMRDPCLLRAPNGTFHMVWTTSWMGKTIGHASSRDLIHWSEQQAIPVMAYELTALNSWAPEVVFDAKKQQYLIFWSSTIPGRFAETDGQGDDKYNHRIYSTTTRDWKFFTPTRLFYDGGFNVIDATMIQEGDLFRLIVKDETKNPVKKNLRLADSKNIEGPFENISAPFTRDWVEGPTALRIGNEWLIYFDEYTRGHYGALKTNDFLTFEDVTEKLTFPKGVRHGTALAVPRSVIETLLASENQETAK